MYSFICLWLQGSGTLTFQPYYAFVERIDFIDKDINKLRMP